tara:strand:+ start:1311 stop:2258 length:948 start_codon:yes stop_codon:yes gene_type:complete
MTEWMMGWVAVGFLAIVKYAKAEHPFARPLSEHLIPHKLIAWLRGTELRWLFVFLIWCTSGGVHAGLQNPIWSLAIVSGLTIFLLFIPEKPVFQNTRKRTESPDSIHSRLVQLRLQLQRLHEKERLSLRLEKAEQSQMVMDRYDQRFQIILIAIENHLTFGDHGRAERIITLFSRHLRHILYEGSVPFLTLETTIEHIKAHLSLMELLTAGRFRCDVDDGMLDASHLGRCTESLRISPWVESMVWPFFEWAERTNEPIDPMYLLLDVEDGEIAISCEHPSFVESQIIRSHRLKLLGEYSEEESKIAWNHTLKVVA